MSETPSSDEEKEKCIDELYALNGNVARMRKDNVQKNDVQRQIAKIYLNCLWGKFAQSSVDSQNINIFGLVINATLFYLVVTAKWLIL